jgi:hypothetical protein
VPTITLGPGSHVVRTSEGLHTGAQIDRIALASAAGGGPLAVSGGRVTGLGTTPPPVPTVTMVHNGATRMRVHVNGATSPFWLVLGESQSNGWKATIAKTGALGTSKLVDGYANGWLVRPTSSSFDVVLQWTPQQQVWAAIWISLFAALLCIGIVAYAMVRRRRRPVPAPPALDAEVGIEWPARPRGTPRDRSTRERVILPVLAGIAASLIVAPWVGVLVVIAVVMMQWRPRLRALVAVAPAVLFALATVYVLYLQHHFRFPAVFEWPTLFPLGRPLGWLAVIFLAVDVVVERVQSPPPAPVPEPEAPPVVVDD